ncbi:hypothetical protein J6590_067365 [Homalodisca vitripennis]|nr:hypothetical protein J6590_067365 [Homalodisca vitripennis]
MTVCRMHQQYRDISTSPGEPSALDMSPPGGVQCLMFAHSHVYTCRVPSLPAVLTTVKNAVINSEYYSIATYWSVRDYRCVCVGGGAPHSLPGAEVCNSSIKCQTEYATLAKVCVGGVPFVHYSIDTVIELTKPESGSLVTGYRSCRSNNCDPKVNEGVDGVSQFRSSDNEEVVWCPVTVVVGRSHNSDPESMKEWLVSGYSGCRSHNSDPVTTKKSFGVRLQWLWVDLTIPIQSQ